MTKGQILQKKIEKEIMYDVEDNYLHKLSYEFKKKLLEEKGWEKIGNTNDGYNNEIYVNKKLDSTYCIISKSRTFCFTTNFGKTDYWFESEVIFETILSNL